MKFKSFEDLQRMKRTEERIKKQQEFTSVCEYDISSTTVSQKLNHFSSTDRNGNLYHLISEGVIVDGNGFPYQIIGKNSVKNWYNSLEDGIIYDINLAHEELNPIFRQLGTFTKSDLTLVENEDGRHSLYVDMQLDEESLIVKEVRRKDQLLGLSIAFYSNGHWVDFDYNGESYEVYLHTEIDIVNFGIVGEPQDAKSGNINLAANEKGEFTVNKNFADFLNKMKQTFNSTDATTVEVKDDENKEEVVEVVEKTENSVELKKEDEKTEEPNGAVEVTVEVNGDELNQELMSLITEGFESIQAQFDKNEAEIEDLKKQLKNMNQFTVPSTKKNSTTSTRSVGF